MKSFVWLCWFVVVLGDSVDYASRENLQRMDVKEGASLSLTCKAKPVLLRSYRWVYIRDGTRKPRVLSSGRRLVVGEPRLSIDAVPSDKEVNLVLTLDEIRPNEAGLFMCWRRGLKPDPQVYVRVMEAGTVEAEPISIEISAPSHVDFGGSVSIECRIRPSWPGKIVWWRNGVQISPSNPVYTPLVEESHTGELLASLDIDPIKEGANFSCQVPSNPPVEASFNIVVRVARIESFSSEPSENNIEYEQKLSLDCVVSGTDNEILWLKDGVNLDLNHDSVRVWKNDVIMPNGYSRSTLVIERFSVADNGQYLCYVPGDSKGLLVNVEGRLPRIIGVKGWDFILGEVLRLSCSTQYSKNNKVTWLFEGEPLRSDWWAEEVVRADIHNVTHHDLSLPIPTRGHAGSYTCTTPYGSASTVVREIIRPYVEESPPIKVNVPEGERLTLPCSVAGYPTPTVAWEKNINGQWKIVEEAETEGDEEVEGIVVNTESLIEGEKRVGERQEIFLEEAMPLHAGRYRCKGYNDQDSVDVETEVIVSGAPASITSMTADEVMEGEDLKISCSVSNWDGPVEFTSGLRVLGQNEDERYATHLFSKEEKVGSREGKRGKSYKTKEMVFTYVLVISGVTLDDQGFYECHAGSEATESMIISIKQLPPQVVEVAASPAVEGGELFVSCTISDMPTDQQAVFYFDGMNLNEVEEPRYSTHLAEKTDELVINSTGRAKQATYVLKVQRLVQEDSGVYHCVVGSDTKGSVSVDVQKMENVEHVSLEASPMWIGGDLVIRCSVTNWNDEVTFFQNQTMLLSEEDSRYYLSRKIDGNTTVHILNIFNVTPQDSGFYQCFTSPVTSAEVNVTIQDLKDISVVLKQHPERFPLWIDSPMVLDCRVIGFQDYNHTIEFSHNGRPFLYLDPTVKGAQVNARATMITEPEDTPLEENELSYRMELEGVKVSDGGTWVCRATIPEAGFVKEAFTDVDVYDPPQFTEYPDSQINVKYGSDLILDCKTSGFPVPQVMWFKEGVQKTFANATESARLELNFFSEDDVGIYICKAYSLEQTISSQTKLSLIPEIKIIEMPNPLVTWTEGVPATLRCMALTSPASQNPLVTWSRVDEDDILTSAYELATYSIEDPTLNDAGTYICRATVADIEETSTTQVVVEGRTTGSHTPLPSSTMAPTLQSGRLVEISGPSMVEEGSQMTLVCLVSPLLAYFKFVTIFNGTMLTYDHELMIRDQRMSVQSAVGGGGERMLRLSVRDVSPSDQGAYECTVNTDPIARHTHFVSVVPEGSLVYTSAGTTEETLKEPSTGPSGPGPWPSTPPFLFTSVAPPRQTERTLGVTDLFEPFENLDFSTEAPPYEKTESHKTPIYTLQTIMAKEMAKISCPFPLSEKPVFWESESNGNVIAVDDMVMINNDRFEIESLHDSTNLYIYNLNLNDSDVYRCSMKTTPPQEIRVEIIVLEGLRVPPSEPDFIDPSPTLTPISDFDSSETYHVDEGQRGEGDIYEEDIGEEEMEVELTTEVPREEDSGIQVTETDMKAIHPYGEEENYGTEEILIHKNEVTDINAGATGYEDTSDEERSEGDYHIENDDKSYEDEYTIISDYEIQTSDESLESGTVDYSEVPIDLNPQVPYDEHILEETSDSVNASDTLEERDEDVNVPGVLEETEDETFEHDSLEETDAYVYYEDNEFEKEDYDGAKADEDNEEGSSPYDAKESYDEDIGKDVEEEYDDVGQDSQDSDINLNMYDEDRDKQYDYGETDDQDFNEDTYDPFDVMETGDPNISKYDEDKSDFNEIDDDYTTDEEDDTDPFYGINDPLNEIERPDYSYDSEGETNSTYEEGEEKDIYDANIPDENVDDTTEEDQYYAPTYDGEIDTPEAYDIYEGEEESESASTTDSTYNVAETETPVGISTTIGPYIFSGTNDNDEYLDGKTDENFNVDYTGESGTTQSTLEKDTLEETESFGSENESEVTGDSELPKERDQNETFTFTKEDKVESNEYDEAEKSIYTDNVDEDDDYYTYSYEDITSTIEPPISHPIIVANPGEDVVASPNTEVVLPCPTKAIPEDITWKGPEKLLFLGSLDLAGVKGLALSTDGALRLLSGTSKTKESAVYTCLVFNYDTYEDEPVMSYWIELIAEEDFKGLQKSDDERTPNVTNLPPTSTFEFPGLEWQEVAVFSNSRVSGESLTEVLKEGGLSAVFQSSSSCRGSDKIHGWEQAQQTLKECELNVRADELIRESQSVFFILDFTVSLQASSRYGSTLIYVHNVAVNLTAHVFGPLVPLPKDNGYNVVECGSPVYTSQKNILDQSAFCRSSIASTILNLQEAYLSHSRKLPMG